jgi:hypothetical protein
LNAVCPDGFEYYFVDEEFVVDREFDLAPKLFTFRKNVCVPDKTAIEMKSKVFDMVLL